MAEELTRSPNSEIFDNDVDNEVDTSRSVQNTVSRITAKALRELKLEEDGQPEYPDSADANTSEFIGEDLNYEAMSLTLDDTANATETGTLALYSDEVQDSGMDASVDSASEGGSQIAEESDLIVLDPDHPLMRRFQQTYKAHLTKQLEKLKLEIKEKSEEFNHKKKEREEIGVELYGLQQELANHQMALEKEHNQFSNEHQIRQQNDTQLEETKKHHKMFTDNFNEQIKKACELQTQVETLSNKLRQIELSKSSVKSDIAIVKRAAEKADTEVSKAEEEKKRQDMLVDKLVQQVDNMRDNISMYQSQLEAQRQETKSATKSVSEASMELEAIDLEKKQLLQQWNSSLIGMKRRDEAYAAMQEAVSLQSQRIMAIETELDGYKRQIGTAQEKNEQLTLMHNRIETDISMVKKQVITSKNKQDVLKIQYSTYNRTLQETEQQLSRMTTEVNLRESELKGFQKQIEKEFLEKVKLEDAIVNKMREHLTADKASTYTKKITDQVRRRTTELERAVADVENEISKNILNTSDAKSRLKLLEDGVAEMNDKINQKNTTISKLETEMKRKNAVIEKKQGAIELLNKKIDALKNKEGDEEFSGPLEFQIKTLQKQIVAKQQECMELQQYWLRQQNELVKIIKDVQVQSSEIEMLKKKSTILLQKKIRVEGDIESERREIAGVNHSVRDMQKDMVKLNTLIHKHHGLETDLQQDNILVEGDFIQTLKDAELDSIKLQNTCDGLKEEKERLLNALVEAERQIMLWEKKTQLAKEARDAVDSDIGKGEMHAMRAEIHRMEVRYAQLMRQQEKMMQDMEKSVFRRECIIVRGDAQAKMGNAKLTKGNFHKKVVELKKRIKQILQDANACDADIRELKESQLHLSQALEDKQIAHKHISTNIEGVSEDVERMFETRQKNLADLISKQQKVKQYSALKDGKYIPLCKTPSNLENEYAKQAQRYQSLSAIVDRLTMEHPTMQTPFRKVTLLLQSKGITPRIDF